ncbi:MAG: winged helix-turn-helix domain-containing protein [Chryseolinea sp.]
MRVNSAFIGVFASRLVAKTGIAIVMLAIFFIALAFTIPPDRDSRAKHINLVIREIGHRLLLQTGDSTSRVLPVTETKEGTFILQFENEFVFNHDSLMALSQDLLPKTQFASGYTVAVHNCFTDNIVYGFQFNNTSPDILACRGRREPSGCYTIEFAFPDFYADAEPNKIEPNKADLDQQTKESKSVKVHHEAKPKLEELKTTTSDHHIDKLTEEPKPVIVDPQKATPKLEELKTPTVDHPFINLIYCGVAALCVTLIVRFRKTPIPPPVQNQNHAIIKEPVQELNALGKFLFDSKGQRLILESEVINLTDKECKILELFNKNFGELIPRETLMQEVWINDGVITGRSLDVFVSKLRKKLSSDPELRITNVHGKGYRLEIA